MAKFSRIQVIQKIHDTGLVPLFYNDDATLSTEIMQACYNGGARLLEFTHRGDSASDVFKDLVKYARKHLPELAIGIGSLTDAGQASAYMSMGADFVVTPLLREDISIVCNRKKVLWMSGCATLTEIARAEELGAEIIKLFPGSQTGPGFVKAILGPQPWTSIMPTGGVTCEESNLKAWFDSGVVAVGIGSELISKQAMANRDMLHIEKATRDVLSIIDRLKG